MTIMINKRQHMTRRLFTMIELLVGALLASIVILAVAGLLFIYFGTWQSLNQDVELQREASLASRYLRLALREANPARVNVVNNVITVTDENGDSKRFYTRNRHFIYNPDTTAPEVEDIIVHDTVQTFNANYQDGNLTAQFILENGSATLEFSTVVSPRN